MKSKAELNKDAQKYLEQYKTQTIYATSDGQFFIEKNRAELHAKDKKLAVYDFKNEGDLTEPTSTASNAGTLPSPEFRALTEDELKAMNYNDLMKLKTETGVETEDNKKESLIAALTGTEVALPPDVQP